MRALFARCARVCSPNTRVSRQADECSGVFNKHVSAHTTSQSITMLYQVEDGLWWRLFCTGWDAFRVCTLRGVWSRMTRHALPRCWLQLAPIQCLAPSMLAAPRGSCCPGPCDRSYGIHVAELARA